MWLIVKYTCWCGATNFKVKEDVSMDLEDPAISRNERKLISAIASSQICIYIAKNRHKKHIPCDRRQLIKLFVSIKHNF